MVDKKRITDEALRLYPVNHNKTTNNQKRVDWVKGALWAINEVEHEMLISEGEKITLEEKLAKQIEKANYWHGKCKIKLSTRKV